MYSLKNINKIKPKIEICIKKISKKYYINELKTQRIECWLNSKNIIKCKTLKGDDTKRKEYVILNISGWTEIHFILSSDSQKHRGIPQIVLFKHIMPKSYKWKEFSDYPLHNENTILGATIAGFIQNKHNTWIDYKPFYIRLSFSFKTIFSSNRIIKEINRFNIISKKIENELPLIAKDIKRNPNKYTKVNRIL